MTSRHVALITVDRFSAARTPLEGQSWVLMPNLLSLSTKSMNFSNHFSNSICDNAPIKDLIIKICIENENAPSINYFDLTGNVQETIKNNKLIINKKNGSIFLQELIEEFKDKPLLFHFNLSDLSPPWDLKQPFSCKYFPDLQDAENFPAECAEKNKSRKEDSLISENISNTQGPWIGNLPDYIDSEDDKFHFQIIETYAAMLHQFDFYLGEIIKSIPEDVVIVLTGNSGIELGDHGETEIKNDIPWLSKVHVPMLVYEPNTSGTIGRTSQLSEHEDISRILRYFLKNNMMNESKIKCDNEFHLSSDFFGIRKKSFVISHGRNSSQAIRTIDWSLIKHPHWGVKLFKQPADYWEAFNVASSHPEVVDLLLAELEK